MIDFTDSANPVEIAYFDRGPINADTLIIGGFWSAYWYDGKIYGTEILRGLDVLSLVPSEYLTENEIAAAALADDGGVFNPQQQFRVGWPDEPVVVRAYLDQLQRGDDISVSMATDIYAALDRAGARLDDGRRDADLAVRLESLAAELRTESDDIVTQARMDALAETLGGIAARLY